MDRRPDSRDEETLSAEHAVEWLHRLDAADPKDTAAFRRWLIRSPQNCGEVLAATATDVVVRELLRDKHIDVDQFLSTSKNVRTIGNDLHSEQRPAQPRRLRRLMEMGVAAALAVVALAPVVERTWFSSNEYTTSTGEQRTIELPDGSAVAINAESAVRVAFSASFRDLYLDRGQAMFTVAKDAARPFRVHIVGTAGAEEEFGKDTIVKAVGTKFDVRRHSARVNVAVIEGIVQVRSDPDGALAKNESASVVAGQAVSVEGTGEITPPKAVNLSEVSAWQQRRLVFTDRTLEEIAEEFRRYNRTPRIRIVDEALRMQRISGVFDADYPEALLLYLESDSSVLLDHNGDEVVIRLRPTIVKSSANTP